MVHFGAIIFCRTFGRTILVSSGGLKKTLTKSHDYSRLFSKEKRRLKKRWQFINKRTQSSQHETFGCFDTFMRVFHQKSLGHILKTLRFLSLKWDADLGRSRLVLHLIHSLTFVSEVKRNRILIICNTAKK